MPLFKNIVQVREFISISAANTNPQVPPQLTTEEDFLIPVIGQELLDTLQAEADSLPGTPSTLLVKCRRALAYLMYFKELPFIHTRITDTGLKNTQTDNQTPAYRYQYEDLLNTCETQGRAALEKVFEYLIANATDYPDWVSSSAYTRLNKNLIKTGTDFASYYHLHQPHRTFYALQPVMQEVEDLYVKPAIGSDFFTELKDAASPTSDEQEVLLLLRKAIANFTICKACTKLSVKVRPEGFTVLLAPGTDREANGESNAAAAQLGALRKDAERDGNNYLNMARKLLNDRATDAIFQNYFTSSLYKSPTAATTDVNDTMQGVYAF